VSFLFHIFCFWVAAQNHTALAGKEMATAGRRMIVGFLNRGSQAKTVAASPEFVRLFACAENGIAV
jgi:hypothetical protein